ncbi:uncharacterized protein LOC129755152 [Uranotaenia lowii]|uniref:uncharacterized protein LOC129755152 n=1 Tax=Uranotaenia lowii TaxID=190385 RepID=UPI002478AB46|nr:uncharacterized protein LOC129755152 [Uranotaenia lowii]
MDKFLRLFIKFHGYCIATASIVITILVTSIFHEAGHDWTELYNLRYTGVSFIIFGIAWTAVASMLLIGVYREHKPWIYPFLGMFSLELLLVICRDLYLIVDDFAWYKTAFFGFGMPLMLWYNFRFSGIPMLILGSAWIMASIILVIGIFKECAKLIYPYGFVFAMELVTLILRDVYLLIAGKSWDEMVFINISVVLLLFIIPYIALSLLALLKLIEVDPITPKSRSDNFVRFDNTQTNTEA